MTYITHRGKEIEIVCEGTLWRAYFPNGGVMPPDFEGSFTSEGLARRAVEDYIAKGKAAKVPLDKREQ